jgi:hypothetical protein
MAAFSQRSAIAVRDTACAVPLLQLLYGCTATTTAVFELDAYSSNVAERHGLTLVKSGLHSQARFDLIRHHPRASRSALTLGHFPEHKLGSAAATEVQR